MATDVGAKKRSGIVLVVIGIVIILVPLLPGSAGTAENSLTLPRITTIVAGALVLLVGALLTRKKGHSGEPPA